MFSGLPQTRHFQLTETEHPGAEEGGGGFLPLAPLEAIASSAFRLAFSCRSRWFSARSDASLAHWRAGTPSAAVGVGFRPCPCRRGPTNRLRGRLEGRRVAGGSLRARALADAPCGWVRRAYGCADVCAEGIETLQELECLAGLDVAYGQGYAIARPSPPWTTVAPDATAACLHSFEATLADTHEAPTPTDHDRRLEILTSRLAAITTNSELETYLHALAHELHADEVTIAAADGDPTRASQLLVDDPAANRAEAAELAARGYASRLTLPIRQHEHVLAQLHAYSREPRPWSRFQVSRARIIGNQLGPLIDRARADSLPKLDSSGETNCVDAATTAPHQPAAGDCVCFDEPKASATTRIAPSPPATMLLRDAPAHRSVSSS